MYRKLLPLVIVFLFSAFGSAQTGKRVLITSPTSVDFGAVAIGAQATTSVQLVNTGSLGVKITAISSSNASFSHSGLVLPLYVGSGKSVNVTLKYAPTGAGPHTGTLNVVSNSQVAPQLAMMGTTTAIQSLPSISTSALAAGTVDVTYAAMLAVTGGQSPYNWSLLSNALPPGLNLEALTGSITGTPLIAGTSVFTVRVLDAAGNSTTKQFSLTVNPVQPVITESYGNVGDAYEGAAPGSAVALSACQILTANTKYRLSRSVNALTPSDVCYQFTGANISLDLNGYKVTGRVIAPATNINGAEILNGTVECNRDDALGGNVGCVWLYGDTFPIAAQLRVHHLTINNTATCGRSLALEWNPSAPWTGGQYAARFYHISITTAAGPSCPRAHNLGVIASSSVTVEAHNNDLTCPADTAGCQGIVFYGNGHGRIHHNRVTMLMNTTAQSGRAILCDGGADYCEVDNNLVIVNNNRAFRVRDSAHARIHDNVVEQVKCCNAMAVHLGDPDAGSNDLDVIVEKNSFEVVDGVVLMIRAGFNAWFRNNTINCASCTATAKLAQVRSAGTTSISFENNPSATLLAPSQISVESGTTATICASGQASGTGTISYNTACQSP